MKQRLVGLLVVLALLAIFLPMISYKMEPKRGIHLSTNIPNPPELPKIQLAGASPAWALATQATGEVFIGKAPAMAEDVMPNAKALPAMPENTVARTKSPAIIAENTGTKSPPIRVTEIKAAKSTGTWIIQLGTFSNSQNIHVLLSKLSDRGIPTYKQTAFSKNGGKMVRIFVGPMLTENQAANVKKELQKELHISGIIKRKTA